MTEQTDDFYDRIELLRKKCPNTLHLLRQSHAGDIVIRSDMKTPAEALSFVEAYETVTHTRFRVSNSRTRIKGFLLKKEWICQHNIPKRKSKTPLESCPAKICISVKEISDFGKICDGYLKLEPPLQTVIRIIPHHNHTPLNHCPLKYSKVSRETRECFYKYFRRGLKGVEARRLHMENLQRENPKDLDVLSINPHMATVYSLYRKWKTLKENVQLDKVPAIKLENAEQVEVLENSKEAGNMEATFTSMQIKQEIEDDDDDFRPIIVSCRSLAPGADNRPVPYSSPSFVPFAANNSVPNVSNTSICSSMPSATDSSVLAVANSFVPFATNSSLPSVSNNIVLTQSSVVPTNASCVSFTRMEQVNNTQVVVYDKSTNTYKIVSCIKIPSPTTASFDSSNQYNNFLSQIHLPTRVGLQKL